MLKEYFPLNFNIHFPFSRNRENNPFSLLITLDENKEAKGELYWDDGFEKMEKGFAIL
jgi:hypothetical protein